LPQTLPTLVELSTLNETNVVLTLPGSCTSMMNSYFQSNNSTCANNYEKNKEISKLFHGSANEETGILLNLMKK
jgi:hypothetical protein